MVRAAGVVGRTGVALTARGMPGLVLGRSRGCLDCLSGGAGLETGGAVAAPVVCMVVLRRDCTCPRAWNKMGRGWAGSRRDRGMGSAR